MTTMKDDTISRRAAIDAFDGAKVDEGWCTEYDIGYNDGIDFAVSKLSVLPSARPTVNTARHGHWIYRPFVDDWIGLLYICSECRDFCDSRYRFCPSCGADMRRNE